MQFVVLGYDGNDGGALQRRMAVRETHLVRAAAMVEAGHQLYGAALLDDAGTMIGSMMVLEFPSRAELDAWMTEEPYVTGDVWRRIEVVPCRVAPTSVRQPTP